MYNGHPSQNKWYLPITNGRVIGMTSFVDYTRILFDDITEHSAIMSHFHSRYFYFLMKPKSSRSPYETYVRNQYQNELLTIIKLNSKPNNILN